MRKAIWRLRNRLLVTYLFIALVPVLLIVTLSGLSTYVLLSQLAAYLANSSWTAASPRWTAPRNRWRCRVRSTALK